MPLNIKSSANGILRSVLILILLILHNASHANDDDEFKDDFQYYVGGYAGFSMPMKKNFDINGVYKLNATIKDSFIFCLLLGHEISEDTGLELSLDYKPNYPLSIKIDNNDPLNTKITAYVLLLNITYDLITFDKVKPYLTAGIGGSYVNIQNGSININNSADQLKLLSNNSLVFACQIGLGVNYKINNDISFDASLRLQCINTLKIEYQINNTPNYTPPQNLLILKGMVGFKFCF